MLKYIKVKNFLSFKDETIISFESDNRGNKKDNVFKEKDAYLNKSLLIYGANASWKTNILKIISFIQFIAIHSATWNWESAPFLLDENSSKEKIYLEIWYYYKNKEYKYRFSVLNNIIIDEKFSRIVWGDEIILFYRDKNWDIIKKDSKFQKEIDKWKWKVKPTASFMSVLWQWNGQLDGELVNSFFYKIGILPSSLEVMIDPSLTINLLKLNAPENRKLVVEFLKCADIDVDDIEIINIDVPTVVQINWANINTTKKMDVIRFWHKVKWKKELQYFDFGVESAWTRKLFCILWLIIDAIINEKILFIDEIECNLHPHILKNIFDLIHANLGKKYQFICTTHSLELMTLSMFKKSQIWITQKKKDNSTEFYTIDDFDDLRSENDIKKMYNIWSLGWVPYISDLSILIKEFQKWKGK